MVDKEKWITCCGIYANLNSCKYRDAEIYPVSFFSQHIPPPKRLWTICNPLRLNSLPCLSEQMGNTGVD
jgi:hypothetical protein